MRARRIRDEFSTADLYRELELVWTEAWAHLHPGVYEYSWYPFRKDRSRVSHRGWRTDKAFLSPSLLRRVNAADTITLSAPTASGSTPVSCWTFPPTALSC